MKTLKWTRRLALASAFASLLPAQLFCAGRPAQVTGRAHRADAAVGPAPRVRMLASASLEKLLDLQAGHPQLLEQRAGTEEGITMWYLLTIGAGLGIGGYYAYKANKVALEDFNNNFNNDLNKTGNNGGN